MRVGGAVWLNSQVCEDLFNWYWSHNPIALMNKAGMPRTMAMVASVETIGQRRRVCVCALYVCVYVCNDPKVRNQSYKTLLDFVRKKNGKPWLSYTQQSREN